MLLERYTDIDKATKIAFGIICNMKKQPVTVMADKH